MNLTELIRHPEQMDRETLYDLRSLIALHPYYQTARILMLHNLYVLHDPTFDEELRRAAIYITDRKVLFQLVEAAHYRLKRPTGQSAANAPTPSGTVADASAAPNGNAGARTTQLIDNFLGQIPQDDEQPEQKKRQRRPTPADATVDYLAYLMESGADDFGDETTGGPKLKGQDLIDDFLDRDGGRIIIPDLPDDPDGTQSPSDAFDPQEEEEKSRNLVREGQYSQALEIIKRLNLDNPKKNAYFADQIRFLEKIIANNNTINK